jgi:nucleoside-diphosphate-sugar epimerase
VHKVLITGAAGFVGRRFTQHFLEARDEVHAVDSLVPLTGAIDPATGWPSFEPRDYSGFHFREEDCRDFFRRTREADFDYALHLTAMVGGRAMIDNDPLAVADTLSIDAAYWLWAKVAKPCKTVCFSSSAAYPVKFQQRGNYRLLKEEMIDFGQDLGCRTCLTAGRS